MFEIYDSCFSLQENMGIEMVETQTATQGNPALFTIRCREKIIS